MDLRTNKGLTPVQSGFPITAITIDLTEACNLNCTYCFTYLSQGKYKPRRLNEEMGMRIIDWLIDPNTRGDSKQVDVSFWGGEPLLEWELLQKLVLYGEQQAKKAGIAITFGGTTNVTLLTPEKFDFLEEHNVSFLLSIDGTQEHHDKHRVYKNGCGSWVDVDRNATEILKRWPDMHARLSYSASNIDGLLDDLKYLHGKGFKRIAYSPVAEDDWTAERLAVLKQVWDDIANWYAELHKNGDPIYIKYMNDSCSRMFNPDGNHAPCGAGRGYMAVTIDGAIFPCHRFHKFTDPRPWYEQEVCLGSIEHGILNHEWRSNFVNWDTTKDMPESCQSCEAFNTHCTGGCWATNWDIFGNLKTNPVVQCVTTITNIENAKKLFKILGPEFENSFKNKKQNTQQMPMVQGCQCYNVHDGVYGRQTVNKNDSLSCLCNMATYGAPIKQVERCYCYNIEDNVVSHYDQSGASCRQFEKEKEHSCGGTCECKTKDPIEAAIEYIRNEIVEIDKLSTERKVKIMEFADLSEELTAKKVELEYLDKVTKALEN